MTPKTTRVEREMLLDAMYDMLSGWKYIRWRHGDLHGVGWDRAQEKMEKAIAILHPPADHPTASGSEPTAKQRYDAVFRADDNMSALERLRFFCSLVITGQDWLDVEPFFDAVAIEAALADSAQPADDSTYEAALAELIDKIVPGLDSGDILADARTASDALGAKPAGEPDPLQGAANWLKQAIAHCSIGDLQRNLCIGYNRASRLFEGAAAPAPAEPAAAPTDPVSQGKEVMEDERKKFEWWTLGLGVIASEKSCFARDRYNGDYAYRHVQAAWEAWQARAALAPAPTAPSLPESREVTDEYMDAVMRVCMSIANQYAFVGDAAFPRAREKLRAVLSLANGEAK